MPSDPFVDFAALSSLGSVQYLDARDRAAFDDGHVPGVLHVPVEEWDKAAKAADIGFTNTAYWDDAFGRLGFDPVAVGIAYDDGRMTNAARVWFIPQYFGAKAFILNSGWPVLSSTSALPAAVRPSEADFRATPGKGSVGVVDRQILKRQLDRGEANVFDTRTRAEFTWAVSETGVVNMPAIIDFYYRAVHQVTVATKQYVEAYYSQPINYAYFDGCSTGGRQSLMEGERYPDDYDGLVVGDAAMAYAYGRTSTFKQAKAFIPALAYIPYATLTQVDAAVTASCDALDGVVDGLIQNPALCSVAPSSLVSAGILSISQAAALRSYITRETDPFGLPVFPGMPISDLSTAGFEGADEISTPATDPDAAEPWGAKGVGPAAWTLADAGIRTYVEHNQSYDVNNDWPEAVSPVANVVSDATLALLRETTGAANSEDPFKLANFLNKGGKVILYHGGSDPLITPFRSMWFYEELASLNGGYGPTQDSARLFIVPGMGHCGGGIAPNRFDTLQALDNWVTQGAAPEGIVATATNGRTMPLCKFPEEASYSGSGDVNQAANWTCNANDKRMLQVGADGAVARAGTEAALLYLYERIGLDGR